MNEELEAKDRSEQLNQEIADLNKKIDNAIEAENKARRDQMWLKKRLKVAKDELNDISNA